MQQTKNTLWTFIFFLFFIGGLIAAVVQVTTPPSIPTCNGHVMSQGDSCEVISNDGTPQGVYSYDQQLQRQLDEHNRNIAICAGLSAFGLLGGILTLSEIRKRRGTM
jgi:hypothetical protein